MSTIWDELRFKVIRSGSNVNKLIGINVAVYLVLGLILVFETLTTKSAVFHTELYNNLALPASLHALLEKIWTVFTYMFINGRSIDLWSIINFVFSMLWFFWIGQIFEEYLGAKKLLSIYLFGGLFGAVFFILGSNVFPAFSEYKDVAIAIGAPACIMAVIVGTATLLPDYTIFMMLIGAVRLKWIAIIYVILDVLFLIGPNAGNIMAHLGGALLGYIYIKQLQRGNDWGGAIAKMFKPKSKLKVVANNSAKSVNSRPRQDEIDNILDKISRSGYESLSKQEKETLFRASKDDKG